MTEIQIIKLLENVQDIKEMLAAICVLFVILVCGIVGSLITIALSKTSDD